MILQKNSPSSDRKEPYNPSVALRISDDKALAEVETDGGGDVETDGPGGGGDVEDEGRGSSLSSFS